MTDAAADAAADANCRFCLESDATAENPLWQPCGCRGGMAHVHRRCLMRWIVAGDQLRETSCHLCKQRYRIAAVESLEHIPGPPNLLDFFLRNPIVLMLVVQYNVAFILGYRTWLFENGAYLFYIDFGHRIIQALYICMFLAAARTKNPGLYTELWMQREYIWIPFCHAGLLIAAQKNPIFGYVADVWLGAYWHAHRATLLEINRRLLH